MGNKTLKTEPDSSVSEEDKKDSFYHLVNLKGEGILVELANEAETTKNYSELDKIIKCKIEPFLYNEGNGRHLLTSEIIKFRSRSRPNCKVSEDMFKQPAEKSDKNATEMETLKFTCWRLDRRGVVGETGLHVCLLMATQVHICLAKR